MPGENNVFKSQNKGGKPLHCLWGHYSCTSSCLSDDKGDILRISNGNMKTLCRKVPVPQPHHCLRESLIAADSCFFFPRLIKSCSWWENPRMSVGPESVSSYKSQHFLYQSLSLQSPKAMETWTIHPSALQPFPLALDRQQEFHNSHFLPCMEEM